MTFTFETSKLIGTASYYTPAKTGEAKTLPDYSINGDLIVCGFTDFDATTLNRVSRNEKTKHKSVSAKKLFFERQKAFSSLIIVLACLSNYLEYSAMSATDSF